MVVVCDGLCASGAYITALASDHIVAQGTSLVGSIGVLVQYPNFADLMKTVGVKVEEVKSSPLKASPNGFEPTSPEARAALDDLVKDQYAWFKDLVKTRRSMDDPALEKVADGRVFTGRQAVGLKLIDELGDETAAVAWLATEKKISADTPVRDYRLSPRFSDMSFLRLAASATLEAVGLEGLAQRARRDRHDRLNRSSRPGGPAGIVAAGHDQLISKFRRAKHSGSSCRAAGTATSAFICDRISIIVLTVQSLFTEMELLTARHPFR